MDISDPAGSILVGEQEKISLNKNNRWGEKKNSPSGLDTIFLKHGENSFKGPKITVNIKGSNAFLVFIGKMTEFPSERSI